MMMLYDCEDDSYEDDVCIFNDENVFHYVLVCSILLSRDYNNVQLQQHDKLQYCNQI